MCFSVEPVTDGTGACTGAPRHARSPQPAHNAKRYMTTAAHQVPRTRRDSDDRHFETKRVKKKLLQKACVLSSKVGLHPLGPARERCDTHDLRNLRTTLGRGLEFDQKNQQTYWTESISSQDIEGRIGRNALETHIHCYLR